MKSSGENVAQFIHSLPDEANMPQENRGASGELRAEVASAGNATFPSPKNKQSLPIRIIGIIGELLMCVGVLIALFIVWQVWWTNREVSAEQDRVVSTVRDSFGDVDAEKVGKVQTGPPPEIGDIAHGDVIGLMYIPSIAQRQATTVREGESPDVLDTGAFSHYTGTAMPGEVGNFSTAIHRESYGARVIHIDQMRRGDPIIVETQDAWYVYKFIDADIVNPTDVYVVNPDPFAAKVSADPNNYVSTNITERYLTITTCHPPLVSNMRWITYAKFDHWVDREDGTPEELVNLNAQHIEVPATGNTVRDAINDVVAMLKEEVSPEEALPAQASEGE